MNCIELLNIGHKRWPKICTPLGVPTLKKLLDGESLFSFTIENSCKKLPLSFQNQVYYKSKIKTPH